VKRRVELSADYADYADFLRAKIIETGWGTGANNPDEPLSHHLVRP
jgi:hypothetical protein